MNVDDAIRLRRSARRYTDRPVPDGVIDECLRLALLAPTGGMAQAWSFVVVRDPEVRTRLAELVIDGGAEYFATVRPPAEGATAREHALWAAYYAEKTLGTYVKVPAWIVATRVPRDVFPASQAELEREADLVSVAFAMENLFLAARARGIGTVPTVFHWYRDAEFRALLNIPDDIDVPVITPFGYPEEFPTSLPPALKSLRRPWHSLVFDDRWEEPHVRAGSEPDDARRPDPGADTDAVTSASADDETIDDTSPAEDAPEVSDDAGDHEDTEPEAGDGDAGSDDSDADDGDEDPDDDPDRDDDEPDDPDDDGSDDDDRGDGPDSDDGDEDDDEPDDEPDAPRDESADEDDDTPSDVASPDDDGDTPPDTTGDDDETAEDDEEPDENPEDELDAPQDEDDDAPNDVATPEADDASTDTTDDTEETTDRIVSDEDSSTDDEDATSDDGPSADDAAAEETTDSATENADEEDPAPSDDAPTDEQPVDAAPEATVEDDAPGGTGRGRDTHIADRPAVDPSDWTRPRATPPTRPASWGRAPQRWEPRTPPSPPTPADTAGRSVAVTPPPAPAASAAPAPATVPAPDAPAPVTAAPSAAPARVAEPQKPSARTETAAAPRTPTPTTTAPVDEHDSPSPAATVPGTPMPAGRADAPPPTTVPEATPAPGTAERTAAPASHTAIAPPPSPAPIDEAEASPAPTGGTTAPVAPREATPRETSAENTQPSDDARVEDDPAPSTPATAEDGPGQSEEPAPSRPQATSTAAGPPDVIATAADGTTGVSDEAGTAPDFEADDEPPARTTTSPGLRASRTLSASEVIAAARTELGLSRIEIAEIIGATPRLVDEWITGTSEPGRHLTDQIEALRGVVTAIHEAMSTRAARVWLSIPSAELDYYTPLDVLRRGELYLERTLRDRPRDIMLGMALRPDNDEPAGDRGTT